MSVPTRHVGLLWSSGGGGGYRGGACEAERSCELTDLLCVTGTLHPAGAPPVQGDSGLPVRVDHGESVAFLRGLKLGAG